jgi:hypothetical protein
VSHSAQVAITKYHNIGDLNKRNSGEVHLFLPVIPGTQEGGRDWEDVAKKLGRPYLNQ